MSKKKLQSSKKDNLKAWAKYSSMGFQMLAIMLLGVWGGLQLDKYLETTKPYFTIILTIIAVILAIYTSIKDLIRMK